MKQKFLLSLAIATVLTKLEKITIEGIIVMLYLYTMIKHPLISLIIGIIVYTLIQIEYKDLKNKFAMKINVTETFSQRKEKNDE